LGADRRETAWPKGRTIQHFVTRREIANISRKENMQILLLAIIGSAEEKGYVFGFVYLYPK